MGPKLIQHDNADRVPQGATSHDSTSWSRPQTIIDWRGLSVLCGFVLLLLLIGAWLIGRDVRYWFEDRPWVVYAGLGFVALFLFKRFLLVEQPGGYKVLWFRADERTVIAGMLKVQHAEAARMFPHAAQLTLTNTQLAPEQDVIEGEIIDSAPALIPDQEWLPWLIEQPHTMIAGGTGTGKTTFARIELIERLSQGYAGVILDPKGKEWFGLPVIGGGRKFSDILALLDILHSEMAQRFEAYADGERQFQPVKALIDEVPDIMDACLDMRRRLVDGRWSRFARQLGSLAREIGISVTLMTQSPLVEDIGMNSAMRKNFSRIALGDEAPILVREERDPKRRAALQDLLRGQQYPAAMLRRGQLYLLDTSNVTRLASRTIGHPLGWAGVPQIATQQPVRTTVSASAQPSATVRASVPGAIVYPPQIKVTNAKIAWLLQQHYSYRQIERELSVSHETISKVKKAMECQP